MKELISVVMGLYNEKTSEATAAIDSILNQTYLNIELIIALDDPSNEELKKMLQSYAQRDERIKPVFNEQNMGVANSINYAISLAQGKYIARMDGDDVSVPNRLEVELNKLIEQKADVITSNAEYIDEKGNIIGQHSKIPEQFGAFNSLLEVGCNIVNPSVLMVKSAFDKVDGYRNLYVEDYDLWLRMIAQDIKIVGINQNLVKYRIRDKGLTQSRPLYGLLATEYVKHLYKQRISSGTDNFNDENFEKFLIANNYGPSQEQKLAKILSNKNKLVKIFKLILNSYGIKLLVNDIKFKIRLRKLTS